MTNFDISTIQAVLFDLDGTLIDSTASYFKMVDIVLEKLRLPTVSREDILKAAEKDPFDWLYVIPRQLHSQHEALIPAAAKIIEEVYPVLFQEKVNVFNGTADMMTRLVAKEIKIGIVTSTPKKNIHIKMRILDEMNLSNLVTVVITADDAPRKKPAPDPLIHCAGLLGAPVSACIYIGDTRADIQAGKAAGMKTIAVRSGFDRNAALAAECPDALIDSIGNLPTVLPFL